MCMKCAAFTVHLVSLNIKTMKVTVKTFVKSPVSFMLGVLVLVLLLLFALSLTSSRAHQAESASTTPEVATTISITENQ
jgi:uncharacterized membrane protein